MDGLRLEMLVFSLLKAEDLKLLTERKIFSSFNRVNMLPHKKSKLFTQGAHMFKKYFYMENLHKISVLRSLSQDNKTF